MTVLLSLEQSVNYLEGGIPAWLVELDVVEDLRRRQVREPAVAVLVDGTVAFYTVDGEVL